MTRRSLATAWLMTAGFAAASAPAIAQPAAPTPDLEYVFSVRATLDPPQEQGEIDGKRKRFIPVTGGTVYGPRLHGQVLDGGGDWQAIGANGLTDVWARYQIRADDGTVIGITNAGVRTAAPEIIEKLARGEDVDPSLYYFRTTTRFEVASGPHDWLNRHVFVARGIRKPDHVVIDFYKVR
ncbi:DUF3237 domain-containing protein [Sphingomonas sp. 35-24ZXX]|uniref:DUF3237 domain-containing protein n=1 Tax=Sphingomonas sp. 35-24ZXX TaxID=1545915 RepID=UPI00053BF2D1|nr:DUF3237 domain-containing protein [Sphingomonas sp. 35-24ZXX]